MYPMKKLHPSPQPTAPTAAPGPSATHIHILLDRSGSMADIAADVIGGFNNFLAEQQAAGPDARITLVQFDSQDVQEVVLGGVPLATATPLDRRHFQPRGGTPLLDATAKLIQRARLGQELRRENGLPAEQVVVVSITDGEENQSREHSLADVRTLIAECEAEGWTFVFLSAALDAYGDARSMGVVDGSIQAFSRSRSSIDKAFGSLSSRLSEHRADTRQHRTPDRRQGFFGTEKPAEAEREKEE